MAINPLTWKDEDLTSVGSWPSPVFKNSQWDLTTWLTPLNGTQNPVTDLPTPTLARPNPTTATPASMFVTKWATDVANNQWETPDLWWADTTWEKDLRVTKIWEVLSDEEKRSIIDAERDKIRNLEGVNFEERNKMFQKLNSDISSGSVFGGETQLEWQRQQAESDRESIATQTSEAIASAEDIFKQELEIETARIQEQWQSVMDTTQRLNSLRWGGRSSANEETINKQQSSINELISVAQQNSDLKLQQRKMEIEGASSEAMASINNALASNESLLNERVAEAQAVQLELNDTIGADFAQSMDSSLWLLQAAWEDITGIDQSKSEKLGYFVNQDWSIYLNKAQNPVEFKTTTWTGVFSPAEIDSFANGISWGSLKFSDLKLDNRDIAKVISAMNTKLDDQPWLSTNSLKAQRILKDVWLGTDDESVRTVTNLLKVNSESEVRDMIATDEFKTAWFVAGNQKLFDDLRSDADSFKAIDRTYNGMNDIWADFKDRPAESRAAMEQALIIMFNKMLDPGSVVREWEFDRTSQGQSVINQAEGWLQKLNSGGAGIKNEAFEDIVNIAGVLYEASKDTVSDLKTSYKSFAWDLWADEAFVDKFFEQGFDLGVKLEDADNSALWDIFGTTNSWSSFKTSSGFEFKEDFNTPESTGWTNDSQSFIKSEEGFRSEAYLDSAGVPTIGYWATKIDGQPVKMGDSITKARAEEIFQADIDRHSNFKNKVTASLTPSQQTALSSFEFNLWPNIWDGQWKEIINLVNNWNLKEAAALMEKFNKARDPETWELRVLRGLTNRRKKEARLLLNMS